jgi:O-antigen/teichoic acid export membrane protein
LLSTGARLAPALLIAAIHGAEVAGMFALAQRILATPVIFSVSVGQVYLSEAPRLARAGGEGMYALFKGTAWRLLLFGVLTLGLVVIAGPQLFGLVFGAVWTEAGRFAQWLALMAIGQLVIGPVVHTLTVFERQDIQLGSDALRFGALLLVFFVAHQLGMSPLATIAAMSVVVTASHIALFVQIRRVLLASLRAPP